MSTDVINAFHNIVLTIHATKRQALGAEIKAVQDLLGDTADHLLMDQRKLRWSKEPKRELLISMGDIYPPVWQEATYDEVSDIIGRPISEIKLALLKGFGETNITSSDRSSWVLKKNPKT